jgi:hypothetical protein
MRAVGRMYARRQKPQSICQDGGGKERMLKAIWAYAEEIRAARNSLQSWVLKSKVGRIWNARFDAKTTHVHEPAAERHQQLSHQCPRCGVKLGLKAETPQSIVYDFADWDLLCQHRHFGSPQLCELLYLGQLGSVH